MSTSATQGCRSAPSAAAPRPCRPGRSPRTPPPRAGVRSLRGEGPSHRRARRACASLGRGTLCDRRVARVGRCGEIPTSVPARRLRRPVAPCGEIATSPHRAGYACGRGADPGHQPVQRRRRDDAAVPGRARPRRGAVRHAARAARGGRAGPQPRVLGPARSREDRPPARAREGGGRARLGLHRRGRDRRDHRLPHLDQPHDASAPPRPLAQARDPRPRGAGARRAEGVQRDRAGRFPARRST